MESSFISRVFSFITARCSIVSIVVNFGRPSIALRENLKAGKTGNFSNVYWCLFYFRFMFIEFFTFIMFIDRNCIYKRWCEIVVPDLYRNGDKVVFLMSWQNLIQQWLYIFTYWVVLKPFPFMVFYLEHTWVAGQLLNSRSSTKEERKHIASTPTRPRCILHCNSRLYGKNIILLLTLRPVKLLPGVGKQTGRSRFE